MEIEKEFQRLDQADSWAAIYQDIKHEASDFPCKVAKHPRNKNRNRYRDVSPYEVASSRFGFPVKCTDSLISGWTEERKLGIFKMKCSYFDHSRIKLQQGDNDYVNASLIKVEEAHRSYILTQGPLPNTCGHFWEMIWEQKSRGVVMLNRVMEKGSIKCAQYWPQKEEKEMFFEDTNFTLTLISEDIKSYYTVRQLELENLLTHETREILHFHYTTWPDFGVPESPASFLNFLFKVRESGSLSPEHGPIVVHCSAGIGRSGTFCLVDTCLLLMDKRKDPSSVNIKQVLLEMRKYRMGLIQTADQLRFSYLAVTEGAKFIMGDSSVQEQWKELSNEDLDPPPEHTPLPPRPPKRTSEMNNGRVHDHVEVLSKRRGAEEEVKCVPSPLEAKIPDGRSHSSEQQGLESLHQDSELRKRTVDASPCNDERMKDEDEDEENLMTTWKPFLVNVCMFTVLTAGAYLCYRKKELVKIACILQVFATKSDDQIP